MIEPILIIYGNNWAIGEYNSDKDSLATPWGFNYNHPPILRLNHPIKVKVGLLRSEYIDKIVLFKDEKTAVKISLDGLKAINMIEGVKEYWIRAFKESLPEREEDWKILLIRNIGLIVMGIITIIAVITH